MELSKFDVPKLVHGVPGAILKYYGVLRPLDYLVVPYSKTY